MLLQVPREELTQEMLVHPMDHAGRCFATFAQTAYFVPRMVELLADGPRGIEFGSGAFLPGLIRDREQYQTVGLWLPLVSALREIFDARTQTFAVLPPHNIVVNADVIDGLLCQFFRPVLRYDLAEWNGFFLRWANDANPHRAAHLLALVARLSDKDMPLCWPAEPLALPSVFAARLREGPLLSELTERAGSFFSSVPHAWAHRLFQTLAKSPH